MASQKNNVEFGDGHSEILLKTCDMHTAGEPVRIVEEGYPELPGATILEKRAYASSHYDNYRKLLMYEPRGHKDMYGVILTKPCHPEADIAVLFIHNEGYSSMCGHAVIALGRYIVDKGYVMAKSPETDVAVECPCGIVRASVQYENGKTSGVRFQSVPAFAFKLDAEITTESYGDLKVDIAYGGAFYAVLDVSILSLSLENTPLSILVEAAHEITIAASRIALCHSQSPDLAFLYGTIFTDGKDDTSCSKNLCVFANKEVDRSPTGSGVTARMALQFKRGHTAINQEKEFESIIGTKFQGKVVRECEDTEGVIVEVSGEAFYTGEHTFRVETKDPFQKGFLLH